MSKRLSNQQGRSQLSWFNQQGRSHLSWLPWSGFHCVYCSVFHFIIVTTEETIQNSWKCKSSDVAFNVDLINIFFTNFENNTDQIFFFLHHILLLKPGNTHRFSLFWIYYCQFLFLQFQFPQKDRHSFFQILINVELLKPVKL
jgi:hypothetical protein